MKRTKGGHLWATYVLRTPGFDIVCMVFSRTYATLRDLQPTTGLHVETTGVVYHRDNGIRLVVSRIPTITEAAHLPVTDNSR